MTNSPTLLLETWLALPIREELLARCLMMRVGLPYLPDYSALPHPHPFTIKLSSLERKIRQDIMVNALHGNAYVPNLVRIPPPPVDLALNSPHFLP